MQVQCSVTLVFYISDNLFGKSSGAGVTTTESLPVKVLGFFGVQKLMTDVVFHGICVQCKSKGMEVQHLQARSIEIIFHGSESEWKIAAEMNVIFPKNGKAYKPGAMQQGGQCGLQKETEIAIKKKSSFAKFSAYIGSVIKTMRTERNGLGPKTAHMVYDLTSLGSMSAVR